MLVAIDDQDIDYIAGIGVGAELGQEPGEIGVGHSVDGSHHEVAGFFQLSDDLGFIGGGSFIGFLIFDVEARRGRGATKRENAVAFAGNVEENFGEGARFG